MTAVLASVLASGLASCTPVDPEDAAVAEAQEYGQRLVAGDAERVAELACDGGDIGIVSVEAFELVGLSTDETEVIDRDGSQYVVQLTFEARDHEPWSPRVLVETDRDEPCIALVSG